MKINEYFLTEKFVQSHVSKIARQPPAHVYQLTFLTPNFARRLTRPWILDIACGAAQALAYFHEVFPTFKYLGLDFSAKMLEEARAHYPGSQLIRFEFERSLPLRDGAVDLVFVRDFFEHVERPYDLLSECLRVTRRYVLFSFCCCKLPEDVVLMKFAENVRYNLLSLERFLAYLRAHQGSGLSVRLCVRQDQPYYPSVYVCPANPNWVQDFRRDGAKKINILVEKTTSGTIEIKDCTVDLVHKYFLRKPSPITYAIRLLWRSLARATRIRAIVRRWRNGGRSSR